jgi:hypothetical protein
MKNQLYPVVTRELTADDIPWTTVEDAPVDDVLTEALIDAEAYRWLAQTALHALHDATQRYLQQRDRCEQCVTLAADLCALQTAYEDLLAAQIGGDV